MAADDARIAALDEWVNLGGRLVLSVGSRGAEALSPGSPLGRFAPGRLREVISLKELGALESYCGSRSGAAGAAGAESAEGGMRAACLGDVRGTIEASEADLPLVVRTARGFGQVIFFAGDLDEPPLRAWPDRPLLVGRLLDLPAGGGAEAGESAAMLHHGYDDLAGQLRSALDRFEGVWLSPFWLVAALVIVYLLLVGPGDFFLLRKAVRRMEWTWLTFPLAVVLVSVAAYGLACWLKGGRIRIHQADLVDVDAASGRIRGATWLNLFSPQTEAFNLSVEPRPLDSHRAAGEAMPGARVWMGWLGLTGTGLGGMDARAQGTLFSSAPFHYAADRSALGEVPIEVWSTKSFTARWAGRTSVCPAANLSESEQLLTGPITNTLSFPLQDCIVAHGGSVYEIGTLAPGQSAQLGPMARRSELKTLLTGRRTVQFHREATPYDQASDDISYILRMMMFYEAAGGRRHVGLWNAYQDFVDLSSLLRADRAILLAQQPVEDENHQGAALLRDGRPLAVARGQHITLYRFVFPVKREKAE
jgi:hypothetical protein